VDEKFEANEEFIGLHHVDDIQTDTVVGVLKNYHPYYVSYTVDSFAGKHSYKLPYSTATYSIIGTFSSRYFIFTA